MLLVFIKMDPSKGLCIGIYVKTCSSWWTIGARGKRREDSPKNFAWNYTYIGKGSRGDVTILPTLVVNNGQYRGKLENGVVLKAICSGFEEKTEPAACLSDGVETNECLENNGGCWHDKSANVTACKDTFRGRVCECPLVDGVQFKGDGYTSCVECKKLADVHFSLI
ncbi:unnamed protein product [Lactuca virosa]|uniref:Vacuolar sorting receptor thioredoxin-like domain-containing protein n=1 Tax=Lactuca virosa TaxID=75947 RepID=A0AAU9P3W7_9ASTR|nr:unnamed protein product [Lactuca virosa]